MGIPCMNPSLYIQCTYCIWQTRHGKGHLLGKDDDHGHWLFMYNSNGTIMEEL